MKLFHLLLSVALLAASATALKKKQQDVNPMAVMPAHPTKAPLVEISPTEKTTFEKQQTDEAPSPIEPPAIVNHTLQVEESKPLAVTGFITKNGSIYELDNNNDMGEIQSRQSQDEPQHICNYGSVAVYSDVPCDRVTNIKIREVEDKPVSEQASLVSANLQENKKPPKKNKKRPSKAGQKHPNKTQQNRPNKPLQNRPNKPQQNRPNKPQQNRPNKPLQNRPNKPLQNRPNKPQQNRPNKPQQNRPNKPLQNRPNKPQQNRPKKPQQNRPNKNGSKRPLQSGQKRPNKNKQKRPNKTHVNRPSKNGHKIPINNNKNYKNQSQHQQQENRLQWEEQQYDDDDYVYFQNQFGSYKPVIYATDYVYDDYHR